MALATAVLSACSGLTVPPAGADVTAATDFDPMRGIGGLRADDLVAIGSALSTPWPRSGDLVWANAVSGSQGSISGVKQLSGPDGDDCRAFDTTVNAVDGLRALSGIACRDVNGAFAVEGIAPVIAGG